ncbi:MAG: hypothetical protein Q8O89_01145 [Nanoarchaeota archaeon]|nr:hypothetical protein [Nanoarchaeota archaeon]
MLNIFNNLEYLEPRCPKCGIVLDYDGNTKYEEKHKAHVCCHCGVVLK